MDYTVEIEGFILQVYRQVGEDITLTTGQARTFLQEGRIAPKGKAARKAKPKAKAD